MKVYISGKITGPHPREYRGKFKAAVRKLNEMGHEAINPARMDVYNLTYAQYMAIDGMLVKFSDAIYMLDNWEDSKGARMEKELAESLGLKVMYEKEGIDEAEEKGGLAE